MQQEAVRGPRRFANLASRESRAGRREPRGSSCAAVACPTSRHPLSADVRRSMYFRLTCLLAFTIVGCRTSTRQLQPLASTTTLESGDWVLPTKWVDDVAFVAVAINGKPAGRFMLDTGADAVVLTRATIDSLELPRVVIGDDKNKIVVAGAGNTQVASTGGAAVAELRCGPLVLRNLDALEADTTTFSRALVCPVAGVLPVTAFRD